MNSEPNETNDTQDPDEDLPIYRAQRQPDDIPGFIDRALKHIRGGEVEGDFTFEDVDFEVAAGVWLAPIAAYEPTEDTPSTPEEIASGASSTGPYGRVMLDWEVDVQRAMREEWGEPAVHAPRLVGSEQEPEGILDYLLLAQEFAQAELWDRGELFVALLTDWTGEQGASNLRQILILLPREYVMNGLGTFLSDDDTAHELFMHGENLLELRRRAWIMSVTFGAGEVRLRDAPIEASRHSLQAKNGRTTVWTFADDGRALLLLQDPESEYAQTAAEQFLTDQLDPEQTNKERTDEEERRYQEGLLEARLILSERILDGVPDDLRACIAVRGETARGEVAEHALEFGLLAGEPTPVISGAFWFDGETWHATRGLMEMGKRNGFGMDDYGVAAALHTPYRIGGDFTVDLFADEKDENRRRQLEELFAACPYPEQPRPEGDLRLGYAIPSSSNRGEIVNEIERVTEAWWDQNPADAKLGDDTFSVGGRKLSRAGDSSVITTVMAQAEPWTVDALKDWTDNLMTVMNERWGNALNMRVEDARGIERRTPVSRVMRGTGLREGPLWWVNGHAVLVLAGAPDAAYSTDPQVILVVAKADTLLELTGRSSLWEVRLRARALRNLAAIASVPEGETPPEAEGPIVWDGPVLKGTEIVPRATRGGLRAGNYFWVWHFTHDGRGLLTSHEIGASAGSFDEQVALFTGVPDDLLTLVTNRDPGNLYPLVTREGEPQGEGRLASSNVLPNAVAVFYYDDTDWRASKGMLRKAYAASVAAAAAAIAAEDAEGEKVDVEQTGVSTVDVLASLYSSAVGVPQLQWALRAGDALAVETIGSPEYGSFAFSREVSLEEARAAFLQLGTGLEAALLGDLNKLLDVIVDGSGYRGVLDATLSNTDPQRRRELALWLLGEGVDASSQLSYMTPINVLLENPTLDAEDAVLIQRLLESKADAGYGLMGQRADGHPLRQLCDRDVNEAELLPLVEALLESADCDLADAVLPDGRSMLEYVRAGAFAHQHSRSLLLERLEAAAAKTAAQA